MSGDRQFRQAIGMAAPRRSWWQRLQAWRLERRYRRDFSRLLPGTQKMLRAVGYDPDSLKAKGAFERDR